MKHIYKLLQELTLMTKKKERKQENYLYFNVCQLFFVKVCKINVISYCFGIACKIPSLIITGFREILRDRDEK